jgi:hypothetical protein
MKSLFLLLVIVILCACDGDKTSGTQRELQYKAGDIVIITNPFYSNCYGAVMDYRRMDNSDKYQIYEVSVICSGGPLGRIAYVSEDDLQLKIRSEPPNFKKPEYQ